ncbi:ABC transporter substrate-binding protein [Bacillus sp. FJAT-49711]|uniref:ABC transporter substrate-binding protein n=1 Tax=Bacillus sp. FJAT-49711 TaxID=2833585 RepID=UPI001BC99563|nr:ABC transporter substrate-binding protein [Bacillus sp. FJAT-49711]MBS4219004.1 ABC transporter substrate-binding protein [Bacillus sp. FJAT-49711]
MKWHMKIVALFILAISFSLGGCVDDKSVAGGNGSKGKSDLQTVTLALSPFQDVYSIHVGIEKGFFAEEGIELKIQETDWAGGNDLLVGGKVDLATAGDSDIVLQNSNGVDTTLAFPIFYFAGAALMFDNDKYDWKTYDEFLAETNDDKEAMRLTLEQAKGKKVGLNTSVSEYTSFISMLNHAGLDSKDYEVVDMSQEDLPPALLSGSIDIMISGIPQRLAVQKEGYETLIDQTTLPHTISHNGFAAKREWLEKNPELRQKLLKSFFKTLSYIEENADESFPIIVKHMKKVGTEISDEQLKNVWNKMEFFPSGVEFYENEVLNPEGNFYWEDRFKAVIDIMETEGKIGKGSVTDLPSLHYTVKLVDEIK